MVWTTSPSDRSAWFCRLGWLVDDVVGPHEGGDTVGGVDLDWVGAEWQHGFFWLLLSRRHAAWLWTVGAAWLYKEISSRLHSQAALIWAVLVSARVLVQHCQTVYGPCDGFSRKRAGLHSKTSCVCAHI